MILRFSEQSANKYFILTFSVFYFLTLVVYLLFEKIFMLSVHSWLFLVPYVASMYCCERTYVFHKVRAKHWLISKYYWLVLFGWILIMDLIFVFDVLDEKVILVQVIFAIFGVLMANLFQLIRLKNKKAL